jgi:hypothetical protein
MRGPMAQDASPAHALGTRGRGLLGGELRRDRHWSRSFPPPFFAALRFGLIAVPEIFFVPRSDVGWLPVLAVGLFICVGQLRCSSGHQNASVTIADAPG